MYIVFFKLKLFRIEFILTHAYSDSNILFDTLITFYMGPFYGNINNLKMHFTYKTSNLYPLSFQYAKAFGKTYSNLLNAFRLS